jgi:hypothetical protein
VGIENFNSIKPLLETVCLSRKSNDIEKFCGIAVPTTTNWSNCSLNSKHAYRKLLIEFIKHVNFKASFQYMHDNNLPRDMDKKKISALFQFPLNELNVYEGSTIDWKRDLFDLLMSYNYNLLETQLKIVRMFYVGTKEKLEHDHALMRDSIPV